MSEHTSSQHEPYYPELLRSFLDTPQLLPDENLQDFNRLFHSLLDYCKPETNRDYLVTYQATMLTWEILRYQKMKVGMLLNHQRRAFESMIHRVTKGGQSAAISEANRLATQWFSDPSSRPAILEVFKKAGFPPNAVEIEAFQLALPNLMSIERLIVSTQKRLDQFLKGVEKTSKSRAEELRMATTKAVDAQASGQPLAS